MKTSKFLIIGPFWGQSASNQWIPRTRVVVVVVWFLDHLSPGFTPPHPTPTHPHNPHPRPIYHWICSQDTNIVVDGKHVRSAVYRPSVERQNGIKNSQGGLSGEFLINYDVNHNEDAGLVFTDEGYFVHYFSPNGLQPLSKNVVFVIDVSGSMSGSKITHTRAALLTILETLRPFDQFEMVLFDDEIMFWHRNGRLVLADDENINQAKRHISAHLNADGSTNINDALVAGCRLLQDVGQKGQNIIFFLTDGLPNVGVVNSNRIAANVKRAAGEKTSVFSLGFGADLDFDLLKKISYETGGWAEAIYTGDDSGQQLENVYQQVGALQRVVPDINILMVKMRLSWESNFYYALKWFMSIWRNFRH